MTKIQIPTAPELDAAIKSNNDDHAVHGQCEECEQLGQSMESSSGWRHEENDWFSVIMMMMDTQAPREDIEQGIRMAMKTALAIGLRAAVVARERYARGVS